MGRDATNKEIVENYNMYWKDIIEPKGMLDMVQLQRELFDFSIVIEEVTKVYIEISNGKFSKPNTNSIYILQEFENRLKECSEQEYWLNMNPWSASE